ncbi:MAG: TrkA family potassium uptake protein [Dehalococcoidia bacterium]
MKVVIMGCGRVGAELAGMLDAGGHRVVIMDTDAYSLRKLPASFRGSPIVGSGLEEEDLKKAEIEDADVFVSATRGDNRNAMACQIAKHIYHVPKVVARIYDPMREEMYHSLGIESVSLTKVVAKLLKEKAEG